MILRSDPAEDIKRPWAKYSGLAFGKILAESGVTVLNDPNGLSKAANKLYFQTYPE